MTWKILGRHRWVVGAKITESVCSITGDHRFTATIRGSRNWRIARGKACPSLVSYVVDEVMRIRDRIDAGDAKVYYDDNTWTLFLGRDTE